MPEIEKVYGEDKLRAVLSASEKVHSPEELRSIWTTETTASE
jgi:hypothetical protein